MAEKKNKPKPEDIETVPDAWERFEKAIDTVTQPGLKPRKPDKDKDGAGRQRDGR